MRKSSVILLLMLASLTLPAGAQPPASPLDNPVPVQQPATPLEIKVETANGLAKAIGDATKKLADGEAKAVTIKITTCETQRLPGLIEATGPITIIGCGDEAAGMGGNEATQRTVLTMDNGTGTEWRSPIELRGVYIKGRSDTSFTTTSSFSLINSVVEGRGAFYDNTSPLFLEIAPSNTLTTPPTYTFNQVTFKNVRPLHMGVLCSSVS